MSFLVTFGDTFVQEGRKLNVEIYEVVKYWTVYPIFILSLITIIHIHLLFIFFRISFVLLQQLWVSFRFIHNSLHCSLPFATLTHFFTCIFLAFSATLSFCQVLGLPLPRDGLCFKYCGIFRHHDHIPLLVGRCSSNVEHSSSGCMRHLLFFYTYLHLSIVCYIH